MIEYVFVAGVYLLIGFAIGFVCGSKHLLNSIYKEIENIKKKAK